MTIEVLYPEICCLFGDKANARFLRAALPDAEWIETPLSEEPAFVSRDVDLLYLASMSESGQSLVLETLAPYRDRLADLIERDRVILATGNAFEIFGEKIVTEKDEEIPCLDLIPIWTRRQIPKRANSLFLGSFEQITIMGYTSRFAHSYYAPDAAPLFAVEKGYGMNPDERVEGIRLHNFFGTHLLGPLLIQNPDFTLYIQRLMGAAEPVIPWEPAVREAYNARLEELRRDISFYD